MSEMTEKQVQHALEVLAKLYADQYGITNPKIKIIKKDTKKRRVKSEFLSDEMGL